MVTDICCYWVTTVSEVAEVGLSTLPPPKSKLLIFFLILLIVHFLKLLPSPLPPITKVHSSWRPVESAPPDYRNIFIRIIHIYRKENSVSHQGYIEPVTAGCQGINVHFLFRIFFFFFRMFCSVSGAKNIVSSALYSVGHVEHDTMCKCSI